MSTNCFTAVFQEILSLLAGHPRYRGSEYQWGKEIYLFSRTNRPSIKVIFLRGKMSGVKEAN
jgi:hypothetical protein